MITLATIPTEAIIGIVFGILGVVIICIFAFHIRVVNQTDKYVVERLGAYRATWETGIHFLIPFIDKVAKKVSLKETVLDFEPQSVITRDNVTIQIDTVVFYQVTDPKLFAYGANDPIKSIDYLSSTTLRNLIGELDLDSTLTSRDLINEKMRAILDSATDPWGIKVNRVELKNILPPKDIRDAMERQMRAEREKREKILLAEGQKQSAILIAEGNKEAMIKNAEADKQAQILSAEGKAQSMREIKKAEADGIRVLRDAEAAGIVAIREAKADEAVLKMKYYEALATVANGKATKIFIPNNLAGISSIASVAKESLTDIQEKE